MPTTGNTTLTLGFDRIKRLQEAKDKTKFNQSEIVRELIDRYLDKTLQELSQERVANVKKRTRRKAV